MLTFNLDKKSSFRLFTFFFKFDGTCRICPDGCRVDSEGVWWAMFKGQPFQFRFGFTSTIKGVF